MNWPTSPRFRKFAAMLADAVMKRQGVSSSDSSCRCPLGCLPGVPPRPSVALVSCQSFKVTPTETAYFVRGFDYGQVCRGDAAAFNRLGIAYRERFP